MGWSLRLGRLFGIDFRVHFTFLLLLLFVFLSGLSRYGTRGATLGLVFVCAVFACIVVHEVAHSLIARRFGKQARSITLLPIGGVATMEEIPERPGQEIATSLIGPLINLAIAGVLYLLMGRRTGIRVPTLYPQSTQELVAGLIGANIVLAVFNLIPAFPMDGGRVLRGILALKLDYVHATSAAVMVGQLLAGLFIFYGLFFNWWLALIGMFILFGAGTEKQQVMIRSVLRGIPARDAMATELVRLRPDTTLNHALEYVQHRCQDDFPVVGDRGLEGILTRSALLAALHEKGMDAQVSDVMDSDYGAVSPSTPLDEVYRRFTAEQKTAMAVKDGDQLQGLLCLDSISRYLMIQAALGRADIRSGLVHW